MKRNQTDRRQGAFSLIELMGVLAIIAIVAAAIVPVLIRRLDQIAGDQEKETLKSFGEAFRQSVLRNRTIPAYTSWATNVALELGTGIANVTVNQRSRPRYFLVHPNLSIGGSGLPYVQTVSGSSSAPVNARMIVLSSIGEPMPNMASGAPVAADFDAIWNWDETSSTPPSIAGTVGFSRGDDLKIQRIDLSSTFVRLILSSYGSTTTNGYSIDTTTWASHVPVIDVSARPTPGVPIDRYFLKNSRLTLYKDGGVIDSQQILSADCSYVYNDDVWSASIGGAQNLGGLDFAGAVDRFLRAPANLNVNVPYGTNQQRAIITNMMTYMSTYVTWANGAFGAGNKTAVVNAQSAMILSVRRIFEAGGGGNDYTPWNTNACVIF